VAGKKRVPSPATGNTAFFNTFICIKSLSWAFIFQHSTLIYIFNYMY
jgi:hypothetical protein